MSAQPVSEQILDTAGHLTNQAGAIASSTATNVAAKANELSASNTGKTLNEHGQNISASATHLADQAATYAKGLLSTAQEKAGQASAQASATTVPGGHTIGGLVTESRSFLGKVLDQASHVIAVDPAVAPAPTTGEKDIADKAADFVDQARNTIASALKNAEAVVSPHGTGQTLGTAPLDGPVVPGVAPGAAAQEPYTSNLMGSVKQ